MSRRIQRLEEAIQREISECLQFKVRDPRVGFVTVSRITLTPDLAFADVYVSVYGSDSEKEDCMKGLANCASFVRTYLSKNLYTKTVPKLKFLLEENLDHSDKINQLLKEADLGSDDNQGENSDDKST